MAARRSTNSTRWPAWTARWLKVMQDTGNVRLACHATNIERTTPYKLRDRDPTFAEAWAQAEDDACDKLEAVARQRAEKTSDALLMFLLKAHRPAKYRETTRHEHSGRGGGPIRFREILVEETPDPDEPLAD